MKSKLFTVLTVVLLTLVMATTAFAQDGTPEPISVSGAVVAVDAVSMTFQVQVSDTETTTVHVPEGFDFSTVAIGSQVTVEGVLDENGAFVATAVTVDPDEDPAETEEPVVTPDPLATPTATPDPLATPTATPDPAEMSDSVWCTTDAEHPVGGRIALTYGVDYAEVKGWFCQGYGFGQIMLALQTSKVTTVPAAEVLQMKTETGGWGQVWHELGVVRSDKDAKPPAWGQQKKQGDEPVVTEEPLDPNATPVVDEDGKGNGNGKGKDKGNNGKGNNKGDRKSVV